MKLIIKKQIGDMVYPFEVEGDNLHECVMESQKLSFPDIMKCGVCASTRLRLGARVTEGEGFKYTFIKCLDCKGELTFGQKRKDENTFFLRRNDDKSFAWIASDKNKNSQPKATTIARVEPAQQTEDDDLPF